VEGGRGREQEKILILQTILRGLERERERVTEWRERERERVRELKET